MTFWALFHSAFKLFRPHCHSDIRKMRHSGHSIRAVRYCLLTILGFLIFLGVAPAQSPPSRPILFVHGWCGTAFDWASLFAANSTFWQNLPASLYTNSTVYIVEYDSATGSIGYWAETNPGYGANATLNPLFHLPKAKSPRMLDSSRSISMTPIPRSQTPQIPPL
jgi:hypothetical protein